MRRPNICILASTGWEVRNLLMSRAMNNIPPQQDVDVICPYAEYDQFRQRFSNFRTLAKMPEWGINDLDLIFLYALETSFWKTSSSLTHQYRQVMRRAMLRQEANPLKLVLKKAIQGTSGPSLIALSKKMLHHLLRFSRPYRFYKEFFRRQKTEIVVAGHSFNRNIYPALFAAKDLGLRAIGNIQSWDNVTGKAPLIIDFDRLLVWSQIMEEELSRYYQIRESQVQKIGPLQFDFYFDPAWIDSRQDFCARFGFDPERKIVVYATVTSRLLPDEPLLVERFLQAYKEGRITGDPNIMIRIHPRRNFEEFRGVSEDPRWQGLKVAWSVAGTPVKGSFSDDSWCPLDNEIRLLTNTVVHGDVNLNVFSTITLDYATQGKPAVLICHNAADQRLPYYDGFDHFKPVLECQGHRVGFTLEETLGYLNAYLEDPDLDAAGRRRLVELECGPFLGHAWERLAAILFNQH